MVNSFYESLFDGIILLEFILDFKFFDKNKLFLKFIFIKNKVLTEVFSLFELVLIDMYIFL